jgi:hypothetical protein
MLPKWNFLRLQFLVLVALALQACGTANAIKQAETVEQKAYAAYGTFVIAQEQAAKAVSSGDLPNNVVIAIGRAEERAKPVADATVDATLEVESIRAEVEASGEGETRLISAINNLNAYVSRLLPLIANLKSAAGGG